MAINFSLASFIGVHASGVETMPMRGIELGATAVNLGAASVAAVLSRGRFKIRDRLESQFERYGFDERAMALTTKTYCSRQAARIACENFDYLPEYEAVCEQNSAEAQDTWLPHI